MALRVTIVTLDGHLAEAARKAGETLARELPGLSLGFHAACEWADDPAAVERCRQDIGRADIVFASMLFMEEHILPIRDALQARRAACDAMVCCMAEGEVVRLTRMGRFDMARGESGMLALFKRLRGAHPGRGAAGAQQIAMLRRLPQILRFIPGTAQDVRAYFLAMQYWLGGTEDNVANLVRFLVDRYAAGPRQSLRGQVTHDAPGTHAEIGLYHPRAPGRVVDTPARMPRHSGARATVGLLVMRSYVLAGNTAHYDGVIAALEARGFRVLPAFAFGLDARPAIERFFMKDGVASIDALVSLTGFSLVGGPAYNDAQAAGATLSRLGVPYIAAHPLEFQSLEQWESSERGLLPVEATMMVALPELDGAAGPMVFGGRRAGRRDMAAHPERAARLADRVGRLVHLRQGPVADRKVAIVLFNFPPNNANVGTAMHLAVFESLRNTMLALRAEGYALEVPGSVEELRRRIVEGNASRFGASANVVARIPAEEHVRRETWLAEIEAQWGPAPGRQQSDGATIHVLGERFGNVLVAVQPAFGYEGDPMRMLFEKGCAPTHAFSAFYRYLREDFGADALLHFGTHGALEFMPGKQAGLSSSCWPERLVGDLPNIYLYAANNPSEGTIAKRRGGATLVGYLTPPLAQAELYGVLSDLKALIDRWRGLAPEDEAERETLAPLIQSQSAALDLAQAQPPWSDAHAEVHRVLGKLRELEETCIPHGLHVAGAIATETERGDLLAILAPEWPRQVADGIARGERGEALLSRAGVAVDAASLERLSMLSRAADNLARDNEIPALLNALAGRYVPPGPGGDLVRNLDVLPTGRNLHGFDPFRLPSALAVADGARQAERLIERHRSEGHAFPESIALVLWGSDNLKSEGAPIGQALALLGAVPRRDSYGRLCGARLLPLEELGRPRIDVVMTLSGIFRDLLPLQTRLLAEAAWLAATADEPVERNFVRKHTLAYQAQHGCDLETAALRVFSNADGAYGSNVNLMLQSGHWRDEAELGEAYAGRKCFAYGRSGRALRQPALLKSALADVALAYQNLDSIELGVTTVDHYFDTLGGISRTIRSVAGADVPVYIADAQGGATIRTLAEQVALESRTRVLNPKWYEGMLRHGFEGVRHIESHVTNTLGWSATTEQVPAWVYDQISRTFVLDPEMRERLGALNPVACVTVAQRLLEAHERKYWSPDRETLEALRRAGDELEDRIEGIGIAA